MPSTQLAPPQPPPLHGYPRGQPYCYPPPPARAHRNWAWPVLALVIVLRFVWIRGTFNSAPVNVGLNYNDCFRNEFGPTFCGEAAKSYCRSTADLRRLAGRGTNDCDRILNR